MNRHLAQLIPLLTVVFAGLASGPPPCLAQDPSPANPPAVQSQWPVARGDSFSRGFSGQTLPEDLKVVWETKFEQAIETAPVVAGGRVIVTDVFGSVHAIAEQSGEKLWTQSYDTGFNASAGIWTGQDNDSENDLVVAGDVEGNLYGLSAVDGSERWKHVVEGQIDASPAFDGDRVLVTSQDGSLYGLNVHTGQLEWTYRTDDQIRCSATIVNGQTFLGGCDARLHRVTTTDGVAAGDPVPISGPTGSTPASDGKVLILPEMAGIVYSIDAASGEVLWKYEDMESRQEYRSDAAVGDDIAVVSSVRKAVDAIDIQSGKRLWRHTLRRRSDASPVIAGNDVWIAATDGRLIRLDTKTGQEKWVYEIRGSFVGSPAIANQRLYIADADGVVRALGGTQR